MNQPLLEISGLRVEVGPRDRRVLATRDVDLVVERGMRLGVVGESGSGKSTTALAIMGVLPQGAVVERGSIRFQDRELVGMPEREYARLRGRELAMVFQSANAALNPVITVGDQIADVVSRHEGVSREVGRLRAVEALGSMGLPDPARNARAYPHQLSGGMAQRALIAMALVCRPTILIADEPTTGLDPIMADVINELIRECVGKLGATALSITHDMGSVRKIADRVAMLHEGRIVWEGPIAEIDSSRSDFVDQFIHGRAEGPIKMPIRPL